MASDEYLMNNQGYVYDTLSEPEGKAINDSNFESLENDADVYHERPGTRKSIRLT